MHEDHRSLKYFICNESGNFNQELNTASIKERSSYFTAFYFESARSIEKWLHKYLSSA